MANRKERAIDDGHAFGEVICLYLAELEKADDRSLPILGASMLDVVLERALKRVLHPSPNKQDELFEDRGPLQGLCGKIDLAYRLGLLDERLLKAAHAIRRIRNAYAHDVRVPSLDASPYKEQISYLVASFHPVFETLHRSRKSGDSAKERYKTLLNVVAPMVFVHERSMPLRDLYQELADCRKLRNAAGDGKQAVAE